MVKMAVKGRNGYSMLIVAFVALGSLTFGYSNVIIGTTLAQPTFMYAVIFPPHGSLLMLTSPV